MNKSWAAILIGVALLSGCAPSFRREAEALRAGFGVYASATEAKRDFDADGDGQPDDPAETRAKVARLREELERLLDEFVEVAE